MFSTQIWHSPPSTQTLGRGEVHVWRAGLKPRASELQNLWSILSTDERARAERFCFQKDRDRFVAARGLLRIILGRYLNFEPRQLRFCCGVHGKPALVPESGVEELSFNLSHSHELALYAVARSRRIGLDLEYLRADLTVDRIAERYFSQRENVLLRSLPASVRREAFFSFWTRKEAYIKACGGSLGLLLEKVDGSLTHAETKTLLDVEGEPRTAACFSLRDLNPGPDYVAALAVEGQGWQLSCWQMTEA